MDNYPPGAANDPNAPYNQKDPVMIECDECHGHGWFEEDGEKHDCGRCHGSGEIESEESEDEQEYEPE